MKNTNEKHVSSRNPVTHTISLALIAAFTLGGCGVDKESAPSEQVVQKHVTGKNEKVVPDYWPRLNVKPFQNQAVEQQVSEILSTLTIEQKVAQIIQPEIRDITVEDMRKYGFGSYLNGGGAFPNDDKHATPNDWIKLAEDMYQASVDSSVDGSNIPTMWGTDAVHGHNNVIGATLFPHNIGLGAANNPALIEEIASVTAKEVMVTGIDWVFAPTVAVVRDDRWGRTYESYSEDPDIVKEYAASIVQGLQGRLNEDFLGEQRVISTVKHFLGDGGTENGDDQGDNIATEEELYRLHAQGYVGGLNAGSQSVMASFNSWHGVKNHGNKYLLTDVLKDRMGFDGFVVGDWNGHGQIKGCSNESCPQAINAGLDIFMVPTGAWKPLYENTVAQIKSGEISMARIDDAVSRVLRVKIRAGLFTKASPANRALSGKMELIGASEHRDVARQAVRESLVLLKNNDNLLPLALNQKILLAGDGADNIGKQSGGWTITWQGTGNNNADFPGGTSIYQGIKNKVASGNGSVELSINGDFTVKPDVAVVVFGEEPYAEGNGDLDNLEYQRGAKKDLALLKKLKAQGIPVVAVFISGRPLWVNPELNASDAFVAAWLPGSEGQGVADVLLRNSDNEIDFDFKGKLSFSWPATPTQTLVNRHDEEYQPLLPYGFGLTYGQASSSKPLLTSQLSEDVQSTEEALTTRPIFAGTVKAPWHLAIGDESGSVVMTSSVLSNDVMHIRTIDKAIQEDARKITWNGKGKGRVSISGAFPEDLRAYVEAQSVISLDIKVDSDVSAPVSLAMGCADDCEGQVDITALLKNQHVGTWSNISVDLACFNKAGTDFSKVFTPFSLSTQGALSLSFAQVALKPKLAQQASISCQ